MYTCNNCQQSFSKWSGKCERCDSWGSLEEIPDMPKNKKGGALKAPHLFKLSEITEKDLNHYPTGFSELDQMLSGGILEGALVLLAGEPGIGKSTFALQLANSIAKNNQKILYVAGEETPQQIKKRAQRIQINESSFTILPNPIIETIIDTAIKEKPMLTIIDSIQTIYSHEIPSETGSVSQIKSAAHQILERHKENLLTTLIVGQITKDGAIAGPKMLEHLVDVVIYIEGDKESPIRILRIQKNRFGPTNEICLFKMENQGLKPILNLNEEFLQLDDDSTKVCGSAFTAVNEKNKIFFLEIQALVNKTIFGYPQRKTIGIDNNRLQILSAVISKFTQTNLNSFDIHLTIAAGQKSKDPSSDLAIAASIITSQQEIPLSKKLVFLGEIGLGGEIKTIKNLISKLKESQKLGFLKAYIPFSQIKEVEKHSNKWNELQIVGLKDIVELEREIITNTEK